MRRQPYSELGIATLQHSERGSLANEGLEIGAAIENTSSPYRSPRDFRNRMNQGARLTRERLAERPIRVSLAVPERPADQMLIFAPCRRQRQREELVHAARRLEREMDLPRSPKGEDGQSPAHALLLWMLLRRKVPIALSNESAYQALFPPPDWYCNPCMIGTRSCMTKPSDGTRFLIFSFALRLKEDA